ncbi:uncharacterized protein TNCV_2853361 [Trichonephila clavipes]|uniref:Uncharacterized protein n=1 Tax=Trichonephila clavipes TaxID=2585209 RepID=A0A8X6R5Z6_TRICX|nr:uncharacterized protein TNCV_2853361 [Trichonephila clavipes]
MKIKDKKVWSAPPDHPGISRKSPGGALEFDGDRKDQTAASRLLSGHLKCMSFESGRKAFQTCSKCHLEPASPEHILDRLGLALEDVHFWCWTLLGLMVSWISDLAAARS